MPLLVRVQRLLSVVQGAAQLAPGDLIIKYIKAVYSGGAREALLQAYALRQLVVILDGADDGAALQKGCAALARLRLGVFLPNTQNLYYK